MKNSSKKEIRHVTFDEDVIAEHDKERGTRMQIPEPDTPFLRSSIMSSDDESGSPTFNLDNNPSELLTKAVNAVEEQSRNEETKHAEFVQKRKAHYNEFRVLKGSVNSDSEQETR